jgi:hypothetical protein
MEVVIILANILVLTVSAQLHVNHVDMVLPTEISHLLVLVTLNTLKKIIVVFHALLHAILVILGTNTAVPLVLIAIILMENIVQNVSLVVQCVLQLLIVNRVT